ncbi:MAG: acetyl-CoA carboxylase biotin carboxyl carrier protein [Acidimicrobiia bacterium]|nr:acetyl-CoA carboxylase biotin carboxyl carrier protein [Acidimicrobiia bacterium]
MTIEEIKQIIELANESGVAEIEVERGGNRVRIRRAAASNQEYVIPSVPSYAVAPQLAPPPMPEATQTAVTADPSLYLVKSPIVGTFYSSPSPGAPAFVKVGDSVKAGQVLCIIESMKLMNEIESEIAGTIVAMLVESGKPVEYGEAIFSIRPA